VTPDETRAVFTAGFAHSTARHHAPVPVPTRARVACEAAARVAEASPTTAAGPTLKLGQLEGLWAVIYARREAVEKLHGQALADVLDAIARLNWDTITQSVASILWTNPDISRSQLASMLGANVENLIIGELPATDQAAWRAAMTAALTDATAEGQASALALLGDQAGISIDFNLAVDAAVKALRGNQALGDTAADWIQKQIHGLGYQVSQRLATMWQDGATAEDMGQAVQDLLGDVSASTAAVIMDQAIGTALSQAALASYEMAGLGYADFLTAGDERVCMQCETAEIGNPYQLGDAPIPPLHPFCRCTLSPSDYVPTAAGLQMLNLYADPGTTLELEDDAA
jgi:SPP1 gp7 family putative phage head morphogenesis protein